MSGWSTVPLWELASVNNEGLPESTDPDFSFEYVDISAVTQGKVSDDLELVTFGTAPSRARRIAREGDVIMSTVRTYLRAVAPVGSSFAHPRIYSTGFAVLRPRPGRTDPRYLGYRLVADDFMDEVEANGVGVSYPAITAHDIMHLRLRVPDLPEQQKIAEYLDCETATIDALIEKQRELSQRLRQRAVALRGELLGGRVGIGERLKWSLQEIDERAGEARTTWDVLSVSIAWGVSRKADREVHQASSEDTSHYKVVNRGDIVINRMRAFQGGLGCADYQGLTSPDYGVLRTVSENVDPRWVAAVMKTDEFVGEMVSRLRGIGTVDGSSVRTPRVSLTDIREIRVEVPSLDEQHSDLARLDSETAKIDALVAKAERFIELAQERRAALITAAVTGQIEIPT